MPTLVASSALGRVPGATGGPTQSHLVYAVNNTRWWFFSAKGTNSVSSTLQGTQSTSAVQDTTQSWTTDQWASFTVWITAGTGVNQVGRINSNTSNTLTLDIATTWATTPANGDSYEIIDFRRMHAWVSSGPDLNSATWSEQTTSPLFDASQVIDFQGKTGAGSGGIAPADGRNWSVGYANI